MLAALLASTALSAVSLAAQTALAQTPTLPQGGRFIAGQGNVGAAGAATLSITQTSTRGVIDWRSFNIGQGATVTFNNGTGATLNRVSGGDLTQILGTLRASGSLYVVNPQGVVVGQSGVVVTGGTFAASSLNIANDAFMRGGTLVFTGTAESGEVRNLGQISSTGGNVFLIARSVTNEGGISAPRGTAGLAAGSEVLLREGTDGGLTPTGVGPRVEPRPTVSWSPAPLRRRHEAGPARLPDPAPFHARRYGPGRVGRSVRTPVRGLPRGCRGRRRRPAGARVRRQSRR